MEPETQSNPSFQQITPQPKSTNLGIPIAIVIAGLLIAGAVYMRGDTSSNKNTEGFTATEKKTTLRPVDATDHILGNPMADLVVIEYSDPECPFCKSFHNTMHKIMDEYGKDGKVAWVYRQMPLEGLHSRAPKEAEAIECVADLGGNEKFWQYVDSIYETTNSNDSLDPAQLPLLAVKIGIDKNAFNECLTSGKFTAKIKKSIEEGTLAQGKTPGTQFTPFSVIVDKKGNTYPIEGAFPYTSMKSVINGLLKGN